MRVIATQRGYDNITTREIGDEFDVADDYVITAQDWFVAKDADAKPVKGKAKADKPPKTMSEAATGDTSEVPPDLA